MTHPKCSIIIRSFNEAKHIGKLLKGIELQTTRSEIEVIVVDSGSTDDTVKIARDFGARIVTIRPEEFSFGRALNIGCREARGEYLLLASAHVYPLYTDWVEKMLLPFKNQKVALVYGRQVGNEQTKYSEHQLFKKWFPTVSSYEQSIPFCNNANAAVRRSLWEEQPYDEQLTGLEDLAWATMIQDKGHTIAYEAYAPIVHVHEETPSRIKNRYRREAIALKSIRPEEKFSFWSFIRLTNSNIWSDAVHAVHDKKFLSEIGSIIMFRTLQFWGTYLGYNRKEKPDETLRMRMYYPNEFRRMLFKRREEESQLGFGERINYSELDY
ncbi:glycosyltransferase family 2 protein [Pedobacter sp. JY14-1]|uniref:glycosyltransferase family 2 protein n=1 Tax=Pedobacter sp. JY14-1 TaxID=3034151 RepID=UPI0023E10191|nr:glycosyltransferase family 2 protein [Pedobacter sp. JY14-1]